MRRAQLYLPPLSPLRHDDFLSIFFAISPRISLDILIIFAVYFFFFHHLIIFADFFRLIFLLR